jgi:hypothetical protein
MSKNTISGVTGFGDCQHWLHHYLNDLEDGVEPYAVLFELGACGGDHVSTRLRNTAWRMTPPDGWARLGALYVPPHLDVTFASRQYDGLADGGEPNAQGVLRVRGERLMTDVAGDAAHQYSQWLAADGDQDDVLRGASHANIPGHIDGVSPGTPAVLTWSGDGVPAAAKARGGSAGARRATDGTVESVSVSRRRAWRQVQLDSCAGRQPLRVGGVEVERYRGGGEFCDQLMASHCRTEEGLRSAECRCLAEQRHMPHGVSAKSFGPTCQHAVADDERYVTKRMLELESHGETACRTDVAAHQDDFLRLEHTSVTCDGGRYHFDLVGERHEDRRHVGMYVAFAGVAAALLLILLVWMIWQWSRSAR